MVALFSGSGGGTGPVHHAAPHRGRPSPVHHATLTAFRSGGGTINPKIPAKYRAKPKARPTPRPSLKLPTVGKVTGKSGGLAVPASGPSANPFRFGRVTIPHPAAGPTGPVSPYVNPFAGSGPVTGERIDQGVDYLGKPGATIGALGPGKIVSAQASGSGWPGGGFIGEQLTAGPARGQVVYTAEDVRPLVIPGQTVKAGQPIGAFTAGGSIESGWGTLPPNVGQALAYGKQSAPGSDPGAYSTGFGIAFNKLVTALGGPSGTFQSVISGTAPAQFSAAGGRVSGAHHVSLPVAPPPNITPSGVNPPGSVPIGPIRLTAAETPVMRRHPGTGGPPTRQPRPPKPPAPVPPIAMHSVTTVTSSKGKGGISTPVAPPAASSSGGGGLLLLAGAAVVVIFLVMRKKGKK